MRAHPLLGAAAAVFLGLASASSAQADDYSPFIAPFREELEGYRERLPHSVQNARVHVRLDLAIRELYRPSSSVGDDLDRLGRAVKALNLRRPEQSPLVEDFWPHVNTSIYLFDDLLRGRIEELKDFYDAKDPKVYSDDHRARHYIFLARTDTYFLSDIGRKSGARAAIRFLQRMDRRLDRAARLLGADPDYTFVEGTVTATTENYSIDWIIATASVTREFYSQYDENGVRTWMTRYKLRLHAHSAQPHSSFRFDSMTVGQPGEEMVGHGGPLGHSGEPGLYAGNPSSTFAVWYPEIDQLTTLDSIDLDAGAISGRFEYRVDGPGDADFTVMQGTFTITSGLRYRP